MQNVGYFEPYLEWVIEKISVMKSLKNKQEIRTRLMHNI
jgi:hypothetical protein